MARKLAAGDWLFSRVGLGLSLRFKLAAPVLVTTAAVAAVLGSIVIGTVDSHLRTAYDQEANVIAAGVEAILVASPKDATALNGYLGYVLKSQPTVVAIRVHGLGAGSPVIASSNPAEIGMTGLLDPTEQAALSSGAARDDHESNDHGSEFDTIRPLRDGQHLIGAVVITSSDRLAQAATQSVGIAIALAAVVAIILESAFVLTVLYFGILRRARRLQNAVQAVERGDTSVRLEEGGQPAARDEMFNLARRIDQMIVQLDARERADTVIRRLGQRALEGTPSARLLAEGLAGTRQALALERCIFVRVDHGTSIVYTIDDTGAEQPEHGLPVWLGALVRVAVRARKPVLSDRFGQKSRFTEPGERPEAQCTIVPLPRTNGIGDAIVAIAPPGSLMRGGALAMLESVAATIAESLQRQKADEARRDSDEKSKVMAAVSHEMRNPLNSILGFTGLVLDNKNEPITERQRRQLGFVQSSAKNMLAIINNYLDFAKTRAGSLPIQLELVTVGPVIEEVAGVMGPAAAAKNIKLRVSVGPGTVAMVDATRFRQVMINLVSNAVKFTPEGGRVFVRARTDKNSTRLVVSDTGVGITRDQRDLVFTEFARIDAGEQARSKGTGLGLALTKGFVEAMGGSIGFFSRRGRGTTFVIKLQREPQAGNGGLKAA